MIGDPQGSTYVSSLETAGSYVEALGPNGVVRWKRATGGFLAYGTTPALGADGSVYFEMWDGSTHKVLGLNRNSGEITLDMPVDLIGLFAFPQGLVVVRGSNEVDYYGYNGALQNAYHSDAPPNFQAVSWAGAPDGTVFVANWPGGCGGQVRISKVTPSGPSWTWTDAPNQSCGVINLAATPDGGVILNQNSTGTLSSSDFSSLGPSGALRWTHHVVAENGGYMLPLVDTSGIAALPSEYAITCPGGSAGCLAVEVEFLRQDTGVQALPRLTVTDPTGGIFRLAAAAIDTGRVYLTRPLEQSGAPPSISAFDVAGLSSDYRLGAVGGAPPPPTLQPPVLGAPQATPMDELLKRRLPVTVPPGVKYIDYGWAASPAAGAPDLSLPSQQTYQSCANFRDCQLDYRPTNPKQTWYLFARSAAQGGFKSAWSAPIAIATPAAPLLIAIGDSVTSGHHRDSTLTPPICDDPGYSYVNGVDRAWNGSLPFAWQRPSYANFAHSGFSTKDVLTGKPRNACGRPVAGVPIQQARAALSSVASQTPGIPTWNRVVMSAGIDDTNWGAVLFRTAFDAHTSIIPWGDAECRADLRSWNGWSGGRVRAIQRNVQQIVSGLRGSGGDAFARIAWVSYYNIANTGTGGNPLLVDSPAIPKACERPLDEANAFLSSAIRGALGTTPYTWVNSDSLLHMNRQAIQPMYWTDPLSKVPGWNAYYQLGWPHPNVLGQAMIASLVPL